MRHPALTDRGALLGGDGEAAGPGGAVEADDAAVLALAGGLKVVYVRLCDANAWSAGAQPLFVSKPSTLHDAAERDTVRL